MEPNTLHKYTYVENNSINRIDPSGNVTIKEQTAVLNGINISATQSYAPLSTVTKAGLAQFATETAVATTTNSATSTFFSILPSILTFASSITIGSILSEAGKSNENEEDYEIFFRAMSGQEYSRLETSGGLSVKANRTELFVTQSFDYAYWFSNSRTGFEVIVVFIMESGTKNTLISKGAVSASAVELNPELAVLPSITSFRQGEPNVVHLKGERGALTYGLRHGTISNFNNNIVAYKGFSQ